MERTKNVFIDGLEDNLQITVRVFKGRVQDAHLLEVAQYADTLPEETRRVPSLAVRQNQRSRFDKVLQSSRVAATVGETKGQVPRSSNHCNPKQK